MLATSSLQQHLPPTHPPTRPTHCSSCPARPPPPPLRQVEGSIQKVQLDNQMLDAVQPVVLAPAVEYKPSGAGGGGRL